MTDDARWDHLLVDVGLATMRDDGAPYGAIGNAAIGWRDDRIVFAGPMADLPGAPHALAHHVASLPGTWVTPGLIDCHTHLVFGGDRAEEFELRLEGATYEEIARAGGGIVSSVRATRAAGEDELLRQSLPRAKALLADGVTTLEIKSGYGLEPEAERRMLRVARRLGEVLGVDVRTSFLGLHALPPEYAGRRDDYVALVCDIMLPSLADEELVDAVDAFCEGIGFTHAETQRLFDKATALGLPVKLHAEQLSDLGGAALVARYGGLSADHLEWTSPDAVRAMAAAGTVAVLLPGAYYALRDTRPPPVDAFREHGVAMAVATDLNPGTSPLLSLRLAMGMACTLFRLTPEEALRGATVNAARALGLTDRGTLAPGQRADLAVWNVRHLAELCYWIGGSLLRESWVAGERVVL
ncbi:imidazolonepropionase [Luteibacter sp. UNCMF331Sha3.1]|nr:imidazolonepropionase [Luteibacter sp. UNCMF331Sha3.1]